MKDNNEESNNNEELQEEINFLKKIDLYLEFDYQLEEFEKTLKKIGYIFLYKKKNYGIDGYIKIKNKKTNREMTLRFNKFGFILYSDFEKVVLIENDEISKVFEIFKIKKLLKVIR